MRLSLSSVLVLAVAAANAPAQVMTFTARGQISFAETVQMPTGARISSVVESEYTLGTPIEMTFSYDLGTAGQFIDGAGYTRFDTPNLVSARIGNRSFSASGIEIRREDQYPSSGDGYILSTDPGTIQETNPFSGSEFSLIGFGMNVLSYENVSFGTGLPSSWDLTPFENRFLSFSYARPADSATNTGEQYASFRGSIASITAVPEPMTIATLGLGVVTLLRRRRRA